MYGSFFTWKDDLITAQLKSYSAHTRNELAMVLSYVRPGASIIDAGAHIGTYAIPLACAAAPKGRVYAFEANPDNFELLKLNITANHHEDRIRCVQAVIADQPTRASMSLPPGGNSGMYYFLPQNEGPSAGVESVGIDDWL